MSLASRTWSKPPLRMLRVLPIPPHPPWLQPLLEQQRRGCGSHTYRIGITSTRRNDPLQRQCVLPTPRRRLRQSKQRRRRGSATRRIATSPSLRPQSGRILATSSPYFKWGTRCMRRGGIPGWMPRTGRTPRGFPGRLNPARSGPVEPASRQVDTARRGCTASDTTMVTRWTTSRTIGSARSAITSYRGSAKTWGGSRSASRRGSTRDRMTNGPAWSGGTW